MRQNLIRAPIIVLCLLVFMAGDGVRRASAEPFTPLADVPDGEPGSLRASIIAANGNDDPVNSFTLQAGTYTITIENSAGQENAAAEGDLDLVNESAAATKTYLFEGQGPEATLITTIVQDRIFHLLGDDVTVEFRNLTIAGGAAVDDGTAGSPPPFTLFFGGGILIDGSTLRLIDGTLSDNSADFGGAVSSLGGDVTVIGSAFRENSAFWGGAVSQSDGQMTISRSTFSDNSSVVEGGAIWSVTSTLSMVETAVSGNSTANAGGGIHNSLGELTVTRSTLNGNAVGAHGGGIANVLGSVSLTNSTLSGNSAGARGGGLWNSGTLTVINSTIALNRAESPGAGLFSDEPGTGFSSHVLLHNAIVAGNVRGVQNNADDLGGEDDCFEGHHTLIGDAGSSGGLVDGINGNIVGALLSQVLETELQDNGGPTFTHALIADSLAIDAGDNALAVDADGAPLTTDQRGGGFSRITGPFVDLGAFEFKTVADLVADLSDHIDGLVNDGVLTAGQGRALQSKLNLTGGPGDAAKHQAFINQVRALVLADQMTPQQADALLDLAGQLLGGL